MFSKKLAQFFLILSVAVNLTACERFLNSSKADNAQDEKISIETTAEMACLKDLPPKLKRFFEDQGSDQDLPASVQCIQDSLHTFMKYTKGNDATLYTGPEIQHFFNRYLLADAQISDDFQKEIMKAKVIFVGGSAETFTRVELESFIQFVGSFGKQLEVLQGQMKLLILKKKPADVKAADLDKAQASVQGLINFFLDNTKIISSKYELLDLINLVTALDDFIGKDDSGIEEAFKWIPLIKDAKALFLGDSAKLSNLSDWRNAFSWTARGYFSVLRYHYLVEGLKFKEPKDWNVLTAWTDEVLKVIQTSPEMAQNKMLEATKIDAVIDQVYGLKLFDGVIDQELAKRTYRKAIAYILQKSSTRDSAAQVAGLSLENLNVISQEYHVWRLGQQFVIDTFSKMQIKGLKPNTKNLQTEYNNYDYKKVIASFNANALENEELKQSWVDLRSFLFTPTPIIADEKGKMIMSKKLPDLPNSFTGSRSLIANRSYIRLIVRGYGEGKQPILFANSIPKQNFLNLEEDFREFAQKMGFIDPRTLSPAARTFMEANFLTYSGDGNEMLSPTEGVQLISEMFSGGRTMTAELYDDLTFVDNYMSQHENVRCFTPDPDIFCKPVAYEWCFKKVFKNYMGKYFESMPNTAKYLTSLNASQFEEFYKTIMIPAAIEQHVAGRVEYSESRSLNVILHYIESLMVVYDTNDDQVLDEKELLNAMPRFKDFITKMSPLGDWFVSDIFLFMVYKGEKPTAGSLIKFKIERAGGLGTANRLNIIKVLALLKEQAKEEAAKIAAEKGEPPPKIDVEAMKCSPKNNN